MSYGLRRLRLYGLIARSQGTNYCTLTPEGVRVAIFCTKLQTRPLHPSSRPTSPLHLSSFATPWPPSSAHSATTS